MSLKAIGRANVNHTSVDIYKPNECPYCKRDIEPTIIDNLSVFSFGETFLYVLFRCPKCKNGFFGKYVIDDKSLEDFSIGHVPYTFHFSDILIGKPFEEEFSTFIKELSPNFVKIYNDAYMAEQCNFAGIVGVGYRRALEFLVKDYAIKFYSGDEEKIRNKLTLSECIEAYIKDNEIKTFAKSCTWLGNDSAHYVANHPDMGVDDIRYLLKAIVSLIEKELSLKYYDNEVLKKPKK